MRLCAISSAIGIAYGAIVTRRLRSMDIRDRPTAPASPWQNGFAERLIRLANLFGVLVCKISLVLRSNNISLRYLHVWVPA